jgi:hypothetical protein
MGKGLLAIQYYGCCVVELYVHTRTHLCLDKGAPIPRSVQPPELGRVVELNLLAKRAGEWSAGLPECMVRRSVASEKRTMADGLRQCIRPLVESTTPGHDGYPLALVPIMWTVW